MKTLEQNIINLYSEIGEKWLANLSVLTNQIEITHGLSNLKPVKNLSYNYVLSGFQDSQPIILKLSLDNAGLKREALALKAFAGFGVVNVLLENDGILLLERAVSGISLKSYFPEKDKDSIDIVCECLKQLHQAPLPALNQFPHVKDWLTTLDDEDLNIPTHYLLKARKLRNELIVSSTSPVLLHGDLHQDNILQQGSNWIVIDPKGVIGEPAYDVAAFIRNPIPELLLHDKALSLINHRITHFSDNLKIPKNRIFDWCYVQAVLAWAWALEDCEDETYFKKLTELFYR